ncbi:MAG TPA: hypothetical protein VHK86_05590 [Nitrososphaera sp.]|jgi:hypothetical protein|nr:hypothetical protein [Nitrososphaera sp.]
MGEKRSHVNEKSAIMESFSRKGVLADLTSIAQRKDVPAVDYNQQIERWNSYQHMLDEIDGECGKTKGDVQLRRNIKHNAKILDETATGFLSVIGLFALVIGGVGIASNNLYAVLGVAIALALVGWQTFIRLRPPSLIHFTCRPALHVDEYAYMNKAIKGIRKVRRDPVVKLPPLEMSIPRAWLAQQGMLDFMESLADIKSDKGKKVE